jgi:hypothetical protein
MTDERVLVDTNVLIHHINGDKHETSQAMAQLEIEKQQVSLGNQLAMQDVLMRLDPTLPQVRLCKGALVRTDSGLFNVAVGLGRVALNGQDVRVLSPQASLVGVLKGRAIGGAALFNGREHTLLASD